MSESSITWVIGLGLVAVICAFAIVLSDARSDIDGLQRRLVELECRHVLFANGATQHDDGEAAATCLVGGR